MKSDATHARKFTGERPKGTGTVTHRVCVGALEEVNRRAVAEISNDLFILALQKARQEELRTALLIECEIHKVPTRDELTAFERAMEAVKAGAPISEIAPFKRRADPTMTLAGNSNWWVG